MANKKFELKADDTFVRSATYVVDGSKVEIIHQPYAVGVYAAISIDGKHAKQGGIEWSAKTMKLIGTEDAFKNKVIPDGATDVEIVMSMVGLYIKESDLELINE